MSNVYRDLFFPKSPKYTQSLTDKMMMITNHLSNWNAVTSGVSCDISIFSCECSLYPLESSIIWLDCSYKIASRSFPTAGRISSDLWGLKTKVFMLLLLWGSALEIIQIFSIAGYYTRYVALFLEDKVLSLSYSANTEKAADQPHQISWKLF